MRPATANGGIFDAFMISHVDARVSSAVPWRDSLDPHCRAWDHDNLYVVDASFFPSSAALNPALTVAAQALRAGAHLKSGLHQF